MDIQEMVDLRIAEIQARTNRTSATHDPEFSNGCDSNFCLTNDIFRGAGSRGNSRRYQSDFQNHFDEHCKPVESIASLDQALASVAVKMLEITDMVAGDYGRLENDILKSKLAVLQSAESILDIAVVLRKKALDLGADLAQKEPGNRKVKPLQQDDCADNVLHTVGGRASMHRHGVAALFKRT